ncbi:MAG: hypothetical protein JNK49_06200 [Planctomycetes bacterium]|nr:hypothetical protein [Planctomycetota bacterium]
MIAKPAAAVLRDAVLVGALAVLTVQALRRHVGDQYPVPSGSMEPTLHGDPRHGDVVFVRKLARAADCRRHDLVVVAHPTEPGQQLVKRIAARGDDADACCIELRDGDVWLGPDPQHLQRERKDPLERRLRVPWARLGDRGDAGRELFDLQATRAGAAPGVLELPPLQSGPGEARSWFAAAARTARQAGPRAHPDGCLGTSQPVDAGFVMATGVRSAPRDQLPVRDCGMDLHCVALPNRLLATVDTHHGAFTFDWQPRTGQVALWHDDAEVATGRLPPVDQGAHRVEFGHLDDTLFVCVDGAPASLWLVPRQPQWTHQELPRSSWPSPVRTHLHLAALGDTPLRLQRLEVFRDLFAIRERNAGLPSTPGDWPRLLAPGQWFLLGDHALDSRDSRVFGPVSDTSFLGRPAAVLGPWPRQRWL